MRELIDHFSGIKNKFFEFSDELSQLKEKFDEDYICKETETCQCLECKKLIAHRASIESSSSSASGGGTIGISSSSTSSARGGGTIGSSSGLIVVKMGLEGAIPRILKSFEVLFVFTILL